MKHEITRNRVQGHLERGMKSLRVGIEVTGSRARTQLEQGSNSPREGYYVIQSSTPAHPKWGYTELEWGLRSSTELECTQSRLEVT